MPTPESLAVPHTPEAPELPLRFRSTFRAPADAPDSVVDVAVSTTSIDVLVSAQERPDAAAGDTAPTEAAPTDTAPTDAAATEPEPAAAPAIEPADVDPEPVTEPAPAKRSGPRRRAERVRNRRSSGAAFRRTVALSCASAIMGVTAFGAVAASAAGGTSATTVSANAADRATPTDTIAAGEPEADEGPTVTGELSVSSAPFTGGTQVTVTGEELDQVASVTVGDAAATIVAADDSQVTFAVPAVADTATGTIAEVRFADAAGEPVDVEKPTAVVAAGTSVVQPLEGELTGRPEAEVPTAPSTLTLTYTTDPGIDAQVGYVLAYWSSYNSAEYPVIDGYDCANFASQSLIARGWSMDGGWYLDRGTGAMSPSWASSTALRDYLRTRTDRATELDDSQRSQVKVGDIAQFDWDGSGDRDHTAVVTRVERTDAGTKVWVGGHTKDADFWDVDTALATGGGSVSYFSIR